LQDLSCSLIFNSGGKFTILKARSMQTYLKTKPGWIQLLLFLGMAFGIYIVLAFISIVIFSSVWNIPVSDFADPKKWTETNANTVLIIRFNQTIQFLGLFLIPCLLFAYFSDPRPENYLGLRRPTKNTYWILGIAALLISLPFVNYTGVLNRQIVFGESTQKWMQSMEEENARLVGYMLKKHTPGQLLINLVVISLFAAIGEELFFRGVLQRIFIKMFRHAWAGILLTAIIFSAIHFQFYGFVPRLILGALLGAIYWYSGSLWASIAAHFVYDSIIIVVAYIKPSLVEDPSANLIGSLSFTLMALVSGILTFAILWQMKKHSATTYASVYKNDKPSHDEFSF
jgi:membrane protease YdiL (CAAX protease family)